MKNCGITCRCAATAYNGENVLSIMTNSDKTQPDNQPEKASYKTPKLSPIGKITRLTAGPTTTTAEGTGLGFKA
jgi:hypothetical protein